MTNETAPAATNDHNGTNWRPVHWHPDAIQRAVDHATAVINDPTVPAGDIPLHLGLPLTFQDIACLRDIAHQSELDQAELDQLRAQLTALGADQTEHVIDLKADGWTIKHPLACRPELFDCPIHLAAERGAISQAGHGTGRYVIALDDDGWIEIADQVHVNGQVTDRG